MKNFFFLILSLIFFQPLSATHIIGGSISYIYEGGDVYTIRLEILRDCNNGNPNAYFDDPASVGIYDADNNLVENLLIPFSGIDDTLNYSISAGIDCLLPPSICVHQTVYEQEVSLPLLAGGYTIVYQRCCRNLQIVNIVDPLSQGMTFHTHIDPSIPNSSPQFNNDVPVNSWTDYGFVYNGSATDPDGDCLIYEMVAAFSGASPAEPFPSPPSPPPFQQVPYVIPVYSVSSMMGGNVPLKIDPNTGIMSAIPPTIGSFLISYAVKEYRDGEHIGTTYREFVLNNGFNGIDNLNINGLISSDGTTPLETGTVKLLENQIDLSNDSVVVSNSQTVTADGTYTFDNTPNSTYFLKAEIDEASAFYDSYLPTYFGATAYWYEAEVLKQCNQMDGFYDVVLLEANNPSGNLTLEGTLTSSSPTGNPVPNLDLILETATGELVQARSTDAQGYFKFENLSANSFRIMVDYINSDVVNCSPLELDLSSNTNMSVLLFSDRLEIESSTSSLSKLMTNNNAVRIYPNPASSELLVQLESPIQNGVVSIYDSMGILLKQVNADGTDLLRVEIENLLKGLYIVEVKSDSGARYSEKLVVMKN